MNLILQRTVLIPILLLALSGCRFSDLFVWKRTPEPPPRALPQDATLEQVTDHLNGERARLVGWKSSDVRISASGKMLSPTLNANLSVESPKNLRLVATSTLRGKEVEFGSNAEQFWFWSRIENPDIILVGTHELAQQNGLQLPFPPSWLMEALGVVPLDTSRVQLLRDSTDRVQLISNQVLDGRPVQRVMTVDLVEGQVVSHSLFDERSQMLASARMSDFRRPEGDESNSRLPHRIELIWPRTGMKLTMKMKEITANPRFSSHTWQVLHDPNCTVYDLDQGPPKRL